MKKAWRPLESKMAQLERNMRAYESVLRERGYTPTVWPVIGKLEGGFGGRRNPFGGGSYEFHSGQDIEAAQGDPVVSGASGKVTFVGWQNGYGQLIVIDHGGGLTTRYGHLSHIDVAQGQTVSERPVHWPSWLYWPFDRTASSLRSANQRSSR